jgi:SagB-type dehydrogenase family enzyme
MQSPLCAGKRPALLWQRCAPIADSFHHFSGRIIPAEQDDRDMDLTREHFRYFLKDAVRLTIDFRMTGQGQGVAPPPIEKPVPDEGCRINLVKPAEWQGIGDISVADAIAARRSHRRFLPDALSLDELSFLLWATQGIRSQAGGTSAFRTVPSAGCRHSFETYLCVLNVIGLAKGLYRYLPVEHELLQLALSEDLEVNIARAALGQAFVGRAAVTFIWTTVPYRMEWRYGLAAHKVIAIDAGHVCQNLYLACSAVGCGTCAVAAYHQEAMDELLGVNGQEEFTLYLAPVGKVPPGEE